MSKKKASSKKKAVTKKAAASKKKATAKPVSKTDMSEDELQGMIENIEKDLIGNKTAKSVGSKPAKKPSVEIEDFEEDIEEAEEVEEVDDLNGWEDSEEEESDADDESDPNEEVDEEVDLDKVEAELDNETSEDDGEEEDLNLPEEIPDSSKDLIVLFKPRCLNCAYLVSHKENYYEDCHYLNGNDRCPAQAIRMAVGVPVEKAARAIARAWINVDLTKFNRLTAKLQGKDPMIVSRVMTRANEYMQAGEVPEEELSE